MLDVSSRVALERNPSPPSAGRFCVLVSSSDHGRDIFETVFQNAETIWRDCAWPRFVGFTSKHPDKYGFKVLTAQKPSNWQGELGDQLDSLPDQIEYVLLIIEDAFFTSPVVGAELNAVADRMMRDDLAYVSLIPLRRNLPGLIIEFFRARLIKNPLRRFSLHEPYYSSFGVVIWKRSHLRWLLRQSGSIWDLEHIVTSEPHYAVWRTVLRPDHLVIKGKWSARARRKLARQGITIAKSKRGFRPFNERLRDLRETIVFHTVGFLSFRLRRRLKIISHRAPRQDAYKSFLSAKDR
jgi:hypothetical protein